MEAETRKALRYAERLARTVNTGSIAWDDLSRQTVIEYGTLHGSASMEFFKNSQIDVYRKIWEFMTSRPYVIVNSTLEGVEFVRESEGRYAFLLEGALSDYHNTRYPCDTITIGK